MYDNDFERVYESERKERMKKEMDKARGMRNKIKAGVVVLVAIVSIGGLIEVVPNGHRGIKYNFSGGVEDTVLSQGVHMVKPTVKVTDFPVYVQTVALTSDRRKGSEEDDSFLVPSKDGKQVRVGVEMGYKFDETMLPVIFQKFGGKSPRQIEDYHIKGKIKSWCAESTAKYPIIDLYGEQRTQAGQDVLATMQERFAKDGIIVESFNFVELTPDENSLQAIQERVDAQQRLETAKIQQKQIAVESETQIEQAKAKAETKRIQALADKEVNDLTNKSISENVLKKQWIEKWDGKLPTVQSDGTPVIKLD